MKNEYLSYEEIINFIKEMACSTGLYGRLYRDIMETKDTQDQFKKIVEQEKFKTTLDFVLWFEC